MPRVRDSDSDSSRSSSPAPGTSYLSTFSEADTTTHTLDTSLRSYSPGLDEDPLKYAYRQEHGRTVNNYSNVYNLPADEEELDRMDKQHALLVRFTGSKYAPAMASVMADDVPGEVKTCLDLGCGSGNWIIDVARDFPQCQAVAIDLIPMQALDMPPNLRSEVDDINLGLEHYYGDFNVVHARLLSSGITDYKRMIDQISLVLRPGGLLDLQEFDFHMYDGNYQRVEYDLNATSEPWTRVWMGHLGTAIKERGGSPDAATHLHDWVSSNPRFEEVEYKEFFMPYTLKADATDADKKAYEGLIEDICTWFKGSKLLLLGNGLAEDFVEDLLQKVLKEVRDGEIRQFTRLQCVTARKKRE